MKCLNTNTSNRQLTSIIKQKIVTNTPFSFIRFGDVEINFLVKRKKGGKWKWLLFRNTTEFKTFEEFLSENIKDKIKIIDNHVNII
jgi:hypothetical protein